MAVLMDIHSTGLKKKTIKGKWKRQLSAKKMPQYKETVTNSNHQNTKIQQKTTEKCFPNLPRKF